MADARKGAAVLDAELARKPKIQRAGGYAASVLELWRSGLPCGDRTGWQSLDRLYSVAPGQMTIVTGWPSSGKSEWLDALLVNLSRQGWKFAVFSFENQPVEIHVAKMLEKLCGKPFGRGPTERMTEDEVRELQDDLDQSFAFTETHHGAISPKDVLEAAEPILSGMGEKRGLVIDPWNELEHWRPANLNETEYVSQTLSMIRNWARANRVHVWIVAHPQKVRREDGGKLPVPRPDMISGSQHWWNKADANITVYRDFEAKNQDVDIYVQKVRFKHIGRQGFITLKYDIVTGKYYEPPPKLSAYRGQQ